MKFKNKNLDKQNDCRHNVKKSIIIYYTAVKKTTNFTNL